MYIKCYLVNVFRPKTIETFYLVFRISNIIRPTNKNDVTLPGYTKYIQTYIGKIQIAFA